MITLRTNARFDDLEKLIDRINKPGSGNTRKIADAITQGFQDNFTRQSSEAGPWARLAPSTVIDRQRNGYGGSGPILVRTGGLRAGYTQRGASDHHERIWQSATGLTIEAGSSDERIALFHERGTSRMPARPISLLGDASESRIIDTIEYVISQVDREFTG